MADGILKQQKIYNHNADSIGVGRAVRLLTNGAHRETSTTRDRERDERRDNQGHGSHGQGAGRPRTNWSN